MTPLIKVAAQAMTDVFSAEPTTHGEEQVAVEYRDDPSSLEFRLTVLWRENERIFGYVINPTVLVLKERDGLSAYFTSLTRHANVLLNVFNENADSGDYRVTFPDKDPKNICIPVYQGGFRLPLEYAEQETSDHLREDIMRAVRAARLVGPLLKRLSAKISLPGSVEYHRLISLGLGEVMIRETQTTDSPFDVYLRNTLYNFQGDALRPQ